MSEERGRRDNQGKLKWSAFPLFLFAPLIKVADFGEKKYEKYNFMKGLTVSNLTDSTMRHLNSFLDPEQSDTDEESGCHHLAHAAWNMLVCCYMVTKRDGLDDRYKGTVVETVDTNPVGEKSGDTENTIVSGAFDEWVISRPSPDLLLGNMDIQFPTETQTEIEDLVDFKQDTIVDPTIKPEPGEAEIDETPEDKYDRYRAQRQAKREGDKLYTSLSPITQEGKLMRALWKIYNSAYEQPPTKDQLDAMVEFDELNVLARKFRAYPCPAIVEDFKIKLNQLIGWDKT